MIREVVGVAIEPLLLQRAVSARSIAAIVIDCAIGERLREA
jgi:hypothetical protein